jgi:uncharacterized protein with PQ loop repeat
VFLLGFLFDLGARGSAFLRTVNKLPQYYMSTRTKDSTVVNINLFILLVLVFVISMTFWSTFLF